MMGVVGANADDATMDAEGENYTYLCRKLVTSRRN